MRTQPIAEAAGPVGDDPASRRIVEGVVRLYIAALAILAAGLVVFVGTRTAWTPLVVVVFCAVAAGSELVRVEFASDSIGVSLSGSLILAAMVVGGPVAATLSALSAGLAGGLLRRPRPAVKKSLFNTANFVLGAGAAALAFGALGGQVGVAIDAVTLRDIGAMGAAVVVNSLVNLSALVGILFLTSGRSLRNIWSEDLKWVPVQTTVSAVIGVTLGVAFQVFGILGAAIYLFPLVASREAARQYTSRVGKQMQELVEAHQEADAANRMLVAANAALDSTNEGLLKTLASVIDARDIYLYGHSVQASKYAGQVARKMGLSDELVRVTELGALLHDIGKIGVSEAILNKPARLTDAEYVEIQSHCDIGYHLLSNLPQFEEVAEIVRSHHEHYDGSGYPRGLVGESIHIGARIVSVVEATEAMISDRPYRKGMSADEVLAELARCAGSQWDANVVAAFSAILSEDHRHLVMHNSALEIALARTPVSELVGAEQDAGTEIGGVSTTFAGASQPMFIVDEQFRVVSMNPAAGRVLDRSEDDLQGEDWIKLSGALESERRSPEGYFGVSRVVSLAARDGNIIHFELNSTPMRTNSASYWVLLARLMSRRASDSLPASDPTNLDFLTGLAAGEEMQRLARKSMMTGGGPVTMAVIQIVGIESINETFGRATGDAAIRTTADVIRSQTRATDLAGRIGGASFAVLMPQASLDDAARLLGRVEALLPGACHDLDCVVEFASGAAEWDGQETSHELIARARIWLDMREQGFGSDQVLALPMLTGLPRSASN
ncbi:MAG TPA: HD domain-containing phosphohydrolase [Candidatus Solibacter sp.]|jgi:diguanylate cyclase (GGDEF)-like protein/putative nucleotidyltransferase with HDIG domain|nr:HD domain-containing phosphohydrolase [Candidatus Solibacter sp.]